MLEKKEVKFKILLLDCSVSLRGVWFRDRGKRESTVLVLSEYIYSTQHSYVT